MFISQIFFFIIKSCWFFIILTIRFFITLTIWSSNTIPGQKIRADSFRKAPEIAGSGSSIPTGNFLDFFRWIPINSLYFSVGTGRRSSEKSEKFPVGILLPIPVISVAFLQDPAGSGRRNLRPAMTIRFFITLTIWSFNTMTILSFITI